MPFHTNQYQPYYSEDQSSSNAKLRKKVIPFLKQSLKSLSTFDSIDSNSHCNYSKIVTELDQDDEDDLGQFLKEHALADEKKTAHYLSKKHTNLNSNGNRNNIHISNSDKKLKNLNRNSKVNDRNHKRSNFDIISIINKKSSSKDHKKSNSSLSNGNANKQKSSKSIKSTTINGNVKKQFANKADKNTLSCNCIPLTCARYSIRPKSSYYYKQLEIEI
eukprot:Awhi_evm1s12069